MQTGNSFNELISLRRAQTTANPALGASALITAPAKMKSKLCGISFVFATDANAADRYVRISYTIGAITISAGSAFYPQTASKSITYLCNPFANIEPVADGLYIPIQIFPWIHFNAGEIITISVQNIQATDQISSVVSFFQSWIYP